MRHKISRVLGFGFVCFALVINPAFASSSISVRMTGSVTPSACSMAIIGNGIFDFGTMSTQDLQAANFNNLQNMRQTLSVSCPSSALIALSFIDNRSGTTSSSLVNEGGLFGLGKDASGNAIGGYYLATSRHILNGDPAHATSSFDAGGSWTSEIFLKSDDLFIHSWTHTLGGSPVPVSTALVEVIADPVIAPLSTLDITQDFQLDGSATIELVYL